MPKSQEPELPTIEQSLQIATPPVFVRSVARSTPWSDAVSQGNPQAIEEYLIENDESPVSLWRVENDRELRLAAIAMNEGRSSLHENLILLTILPSELQQAGVQLAASSGDTSCSPAKKLHFDAEMSGSVRLTLLSILVAAKRQLGRCPKGGMKKVEELAILDKCFAAVETSKHCACGASR